VIERRFVPTGSAPVGVTSRGNGEKTISGYAAVFYRSGTPGTEYRLWDDAVERISRCAFDRAIREKHDVRGLFNHDPNNLLGRYSSGTCRYSIDANGLKYEIDFDPSDPDHQRVIAKIDRGDLTGSSFAFRVNAATWEDRMGLPSIRWIDDLTLFDVGPVTWPAYDATTTGLI
jgi:HK97 family phage prohead protease